VKVASASARVMVPLSASCPRQKGAGIEVEQPQQVQHQRELREVGIPQSRNRPAADVALGVDPERDPPVDLPRYSGIFEVPANLGQLDPVDGDVQVDRAALLGEGHRHRAARAAAAPGGDRVLKAPFLFSNMHAAADVGDWREDRVRKPPHAELAHQVVEPDEIVEKSARRRGILRRLTAAARRRGGRLGRGRCAHDKARRGGERHRRETPRRKARADCASAGHGFALPFRHGGSSRPALASA